jgi:hypothetical protein
VNPIKTIGMQPTVWAEGSPNSYNVSCNFSAGHYCASGVVSYGGGNSDFVRSYPAGFYQYYNDWCTLNNTCGNLNNSNNDPFTVISNNLILIKGSDGSIMALKNGNPLSRSIMLATALNQSDPVPNSGVTPIANIHKYLGKYVTVVATVTQVVERQPSAWYVTLKDLSGEIQMRIFMRDIHKFSYSPQTLFGKTVKINGLSSLYGPQGFNTELEISGPDQISITNPVTSFFNSVVNLFSRYLHI